MFDKTFVQALGTVICKRGVVYCGEMALEAGTPNTYLTTHKLPVGLRGLLAQEIATEAAIQNDACDNYMIRARVITMEIVSEMVGYKIFGDNIVTLIQELIALEKQASDMYYAAKDASRA